MTVAEGVTLIGAVAAAVVSILTAAIALYSAQKASSTHSMVNGISGKLERANIAQGHAEGVAEQLGVASATEALSVQVEPRAGPPPAS